MPVDFVEYCKLVLDRVSQSSAFVQHLAGSGWQTRKKTDSVQKGYSEEAEYASYRSSTRSIMTWRCVEFCRDMNLVGEGVYLDFLFGVDVPARAFLDDRLWQAAD